VIKCSMYDKTGHKPGNAAPRVRSAARAISVVARAFAATVTSNGSTAGEPAVTRVFDRQKGGTKASTRWEAAGSYASSRVGLGLVAFASTVQKRRPLGDRTQACRLWHLSNVRRIILCGSTPDVASPVRKWGWRRPGKRHLIQEFARQGCWLCAVAVPRIKERRAVKRDQKLYHRRRGGSLGREESAVYKTTENY
jgi:hypothetical protein